MNNMIDNPLGTDGFEFVEFTGPDVGLLSDFFKRMGFVEIAKHRRKDVSLYRQGDINFIVNNEPGSAAEAFYGVHGPGANAMAFRVHNAAEAFEEAIKRGAKAVTHPVGPMELNIPAIEGIGGLIIYLVDRYGADNIYDVDFKPTGAQPSEAAQLSYIDHLTHNVRRGNMAVWAEFYERVFNFKEIRYFDIEGKKTGLTSKAMTSPCGKIRIPLNESQDDHSQIEEFLRKYNGEGIQHIALGSEDIYFTVDRLRQEGIPFQDTPDTYYDLVDKRLPDHGEDLEAMKELRILIDGGEAQGGGKLLQIFTKESIGPIFIEFIQRKGNEGFGEGNFQALFESIELDQMRRGVLA